MFLSCRKMLKLISVNPLIRVRFPRERDNCPPAPRPHGAARTPHHGPRARRPPQVAAAPVFPGSPPVTQRGSTVRDRRAITQCRRLSGGAAILSRLACPGSQGRCGAARGNNVETLHPVETPHAYSVFYFRRMQSFHANGTASPDGRAVTWRMILKATTPPLSQGHCAYCVSYFRQPKSFYANGARSRWPGRYPAHVLKRHAPGQ
jgi:hypothetical protein